VQTVVLFSAICSFFSYEVVIIQGLLKKNEKKLVRSFNFTFRYIDDVRSLNNSRFGDFVDRLSPFELEIKDTTDTDRSAAYLDLHLKIDSKGRLRTDTLRQKKWFQFSHCELSIYMKKHSNSTCVWSIYLAIYSRACLSFWIICLAIVLYVLLRYTDSDYPLVSSNSSLFIQPCITCLLSGT
jgi:hypothetical protein